MNAQQMKATVMAARMGDVLCSTQAEKNAWKKRMLSAGLLGVSFPSDWDSLSEDEKERRLDTAMKAGVERKI